ncbi:MAG: asparagine synthase (glutamine-hydrolyzing) [Candidatus Acidiferrales bacterium]
MCGIAGFTHSKGAPAPDRIEQAVRMLMHRGPDQQGVYRTGVASLGAARLKILDLHGGDQPIVADGGDSVIAFNGEIYNHQELRVELERLGHRFHSHSDTETVLHGFLEWDTECFSRLRGMFAIALWTESRKRLVLARDRVGIKPLYFTRRGDDLYFGSELKAILVHPEIERRLSLAGLDGYLSLNYVPCPWTLVEGIEKLPPGQWLEWRDGKISTGTYWRLPIDSPGAASLPEAEQELDRLLQDSVREHLLSDVPLGVWLSGGIDSSTILHYAAKATSSRLKTFSISFQGRTFDEAPYFREAAKLYGTDHEEFDLNIEADLENAIGEFAYYSDEPSADAGALPVWFLSKLTKMQVTVVLSGEGADEIFGGYLTYPADRMARKFRRLPSSVLGFGRRAADLLPASDEKISFEYKVKRFLEGCRMAPARAHVYWNGTFSDAEKRALLNQACPPALASALGELREKLGSPDWLAPYLWFDQKYFLPDDILTKADRMSMAHSLEVRPPFLDHRIVEFAARLPADFKIRGSMQKFILKDLMKRALPPSILRRKKTGFDIPAHQWLRGPLKKMLLDAIATGTTEHGALFNRAAIDSCVRRHMERRANLGYNLWGLLILFLWMKRWNIQTTPLSPPAQTAREGVLSST